MCRRRPLVCRNAATACTYRFSHLPACSRASRTSRVLVGTFSCAENISAALLSADQAPVWYRHITGAESNSAGASSPKILSVGRQPPINNRWALFYRIIFGSDQLPKIPYCHHKPAGIPRGWVSCTQVQQAQASSSKKGRPRAPRRKLPLCAQQIPRQWRGPVWSISLSLIG